MAILRTALPFSWLLVALSTTAAATGQNLVRDINTTAPGASSNPESLAASGGLVYFIADDGVHGREVWWTEGGYAALAADIKPGPDSSNPAGIRPFQGGVLTIADDGVHGRELHWITQSSDTLLEVNPGSLGTAFGAGVVYDTSFYFVAWTPATGYELWVTDLVTVRLVREIVSGTGDGVASYAGMAVVNDQILFNATDPLHGMELWKTDGTPAGTVLVKDIAPGQTSGLGSGNALVGNGSVAFFMAYEAATGNELWMTDGSTAGTVLVDDLVPGAASSQPEPMVFRDLRLYLRAQTPATGRELFSVLVNGGPITLVKDITPGTGSSSLTSFRPAGDLLFFATTNSGAAQIHRTDGTLAGTFPVRGSLGPPALAGTMMEAVGIGTRVLFQGVEGGTTGNEPWLSDGTAAGTVRLLDLEPGPSSSMPSWFTVVGNRVVFAATQAAVGSELFSVPLPLTRGCIVETLQPGCPGPTGRIPSLAGSGIPRFGSAFALRLSRAPANVPAIFALSFSGMPGVGGCALQVGPVASGTVLFTSGTGTAHMPLPVPSTPTLLSLQLFAQAAVVEVGGGYLGMASLSNGLRIVVGDS